MLSVPSRLVNQRTGDVIVRTVEVADTRASRRRGLLGRDCLEASSALLISPCFAVHTAFMRFAIDVVFVDRNGCVVRIVRELPPWRMAGAWRAHRVIELAAGELGTRDVRVGDRLYLDPPGAAGAATSSSSSPAESLRRTASKPACSGS
jgi:uncharacterized membrane protein (UPF0127 family)